MIAGRCIRRIFAPKIGVYIGLNHDETDGETVREKQTSSGSISSIFLEKKTLLGNGSIRKKRQNRPYFVTGLVVPFLKILEAYVLTTQSPSIAVYAAKCGRQYQ